MFEAVELNASMSKETFEKAELKLRPQLLEAQEALRAKKISLLIIVSGVEGAGKPEVVHRLHEWLDPRGIDTHAFWEYSEEERERPPSWRYWRVLPGRGRVAIFFGSWYTQPILRRVYGQSKKSELDSALSRIGFLERMLAQDRLLLVKFWFHLSKKEQYKHFKKLEKDPHARTRVLPADWKNHKLYGKFVKTCERVLRQTDSAEAPWLLVEATDRRHRDITTGRLLLQRIHKRLAELDKAADKTAPTPARIQRARKRTVLDSVDLTQKLSDTKYDKDLEKYQGRLNKLVWAALEKKVSTVIVMEGCDAAGKGSSIRRLTQAMDPRLYKVIPIAAPTDEEKAHHYLWRFWRHLPRRGRVTIFDRSWYGRVLVERVEGFATVPEWSRAFLEINSFEEELTEFGVALLKFWIQISQDEQLRRFKERQQTPHKRFKITEEDWRNREKWEAYKEAINDMVIHTSTEFAPWTLIAGNDKKFARIQLLKSVCSGLEARL